MSKYLCEFCQEKLVVLNRKFENLCEACFHYLEGRERERREEEAA